jgi:hypothetical protein
LDIPISRAISKQTSAFLGSWTGYSMSHVMELDLKWVSEYQARLGEISFPYQISYIRWAAHDDNAIPEPHICEFVKPCFHLLTAAPHVPAKCDTAETPDRSAGCASPRMQKKCRRQCVDCPLFGAAGESRKTNLTWTDGTPIKIWRSNLREQPLERVSTRVEVPAWELLTLRIEVPNS